MSLLLNMRNIIHLELRGSDPKLKKAIGRVMNAIDSDLDTEGYVPSSEVVEELSKLDNVILELDNNIQINEDGADELVKFPPTIPKDIPE